MSFKKNKPLTPGFVRGFSEAEGAFLVNYSSNPSAFTYHTTFNVSQKTREVLDLLQVFFNGVGNVQPFQRIDPRNGQTYTGFAYNVSNVDDLKREILPFFEANQLIASKKLDFELFKYAVNFRLLRVRNSTGWYPQEKRDVIEAGYEMNTQGRQRRLTKSELLSVHNVQNLQLSNGAVQDLVAQQNNYLLNVLPSLKLTPEYVSGFMCGDGGLNVPLGARIRIFLNVSDHERTILDKIHQFFDKGKVYNIGGAPTSKKWRYQTDVSMRFGEEVLLPFFKAHPFRGERRKTLEIFEEIFVFMKVCF